MRNLPMLVTGIAVEHSGSTKRLNLIARKPVSSVPRTLKPKGKD